MGHHLPWWLKGVQPRYGRHGLGCSSLRSQLHKISRASSAVLMPASLGGVTTMRRRSWVVDPTHPIVQGIKENIILEEDDGYYEHDYPLLMSLYLSVGSQAVKYSVQVAYSREQLQEIFYFRPGHEWASSHILQRKGSESNQERCWVR